VLPCQKRRFHPFIKASFLLQSIRPQLFVLEVICYHWYNQKGKIRTEKQKRSWGARLVSHIQTSRCFLSLPLLRRVGLEAEAGLGKCEKKQPKNLSPQTIFLTQRE
jgi:hypothetical protein